MFSIEIFLCGNEIYKEQCITIVLQEPFYAV